MLTDLLQSSMFKTSRFETALWAAKLCLLFVGIISTGILFKVAIIPYTLHLILYTLPSLWISARSWLSPPFIYIILNFIIITIAASTTFQRQNHHQENKPTKTPPKTQNSLQRNQSNNYRTTANHAIWQWQDVIHGHEKQVDSTLSTEKSVKHSQDSVKTHQENMSAEEPKEEENKEDREYSLDDTWNFIMEGQGKTPARQLKKSDTWDTPPRVLDKASEVDDDIDPVAWGRRELKKSETFNDAVPLRRDKSMSTDELNLRAKEFIQKFNDELRLQREESNLRFREMMNRSF